MLHRIKHSCQTKHLFHGCLLIPTSSQLPVALGILVLVCQFKKGCIDLALTSAIEQHNIQALWLDNNAVALATR